jgi:hypothetical protein
VTSPKRPDRCPAAEIWGARLLGLAAVAALLRLPRLAELAAVCLAGLALWSLLRTGSARSRLQIGIALPVLWLASPGALWPVVWIAAALFHVAMREKTWLERFASLLTMAFPALLLLAAQAYYRWLGYRPFFQ